MLDAHIRPITSMDQRSGDFIEGRESYNDENRPVVDSDPAQGTLAAYSYSPLGNLRSSRYRAESEGTNIDTSAQSIPLLDRSPPVPQEIEMSSSGINEPFRRPINPGPQSHRNDNDEGIQGYCDFMDQFNEILRSAIADIENRTDDVDSEESNRLLIGLDDCSKGRRYILNMSRANRTTVANSFERWDEDRIASLVQFAHELAKVTTTLDAFIQEYRGQEGLSLETAEQVTDCLLALEIVAPKVELLKKCFYSNDERRSIHIQRT